MKRALGLPAAALLVVAALCSCTGRDRLAGSEIGNPTGAVAGRALYPDGKPAANALVRLRRADYLAGIPAPAKIGLSRADARTDAQGRFTIDSLDSGEYRIEINDGSRNGLLLEVDVKAGKRADLPVDTVRPTGSLTGTVKFIDPVSARYAALLYGLERAAPIDSVTGRFTLEDCPAGRFTVRLDCVGGDCLSKEVAGVEVIAGAPSTIDTITLSTFAAEDYSKWARAMRITINTTAAGADVAEPVAGFPLLVRLDTSVFDFASADSRGRDIRFSDDRGAHLRYEVERWDAAAGKAEVWVRLDTVPGNSDARFITAHWGNPGGEAYSAGREVFPARDGHRAVWHLAGEGVDGPGIHRDAAQDNHGTGSGMAAPVAGAVGPARTFADGGFIGAGSDSSLHSAAALTLEAWANFTTLRQNMQLVSKAFTASANPWHEYDLESNDGGQKFSFGVGVGDSNFAVTGTTAIALDTWYHVAGTYDGSQLRIYVNGRLETSAPHSGAISDFGRPVTLGKLEHDDGGDFHGKLDEVRISGVARSAAWIRLAYENQRPGSRLLMFAN